MSEYELEHDFETIQEHEEAETARSIIPFAEGWD